MKNFVRCTLLVCLLMAHSIKAAESIAFYYDAIDSVRELINYDRVVVEPNHISKSQIITLHKAGTKVFAYLSVGEYSGNKFPLELLPFKRTENSQWKSAVMDLTAEAWQSYLYKQAEAFSDRDFDGLFLDTLDSYQLFAKERTTDLQQKQSLVTIIDKLDTVFAIKPTNKTRLILNRGFEIIDRLNIANPVVVAESLFNKYSPTDGSYSQVSEEDRTWLINQLSTLMERGIEVVIIDYIIETNRKKQLEAAKRLVQLGYTPYISNGELSTFGVSTIVPVAKRVLGFFDGKTIDESHSQCHRLFAVALEYLGYVPECKDINSTDFVAIDTSRYAGVYFWVASEVYTGNKALLTFIDNLINHTPILFIGDIPESEKIREKLGLAINGTLARGVKVTGGMELFIRGIPAFSPFNSYPVWHISRDKGRPLVVLSDDSGKTSDNYIVAKWGGAIFSPLPVVSSNNYDQADKWLVDRFELLTTTLGLKNIPAADVTTESGRRVMTSHIDGDGFPSKSSFQGRPYASEVILEKVLKKYKVPQTVSIIEGEISRHGLYPKLSIDLENIARKIFKLENVEVASHTFSHPFYWDFSGTVSNKRYGEHLAIPDYKLDLEREIIGSVKYIDDNLLSDGKKTKVILWSGNADPTEEIVEISDRAGLLNVNGGNTFTIKGEDDYREIFPAIMWHQNAVQVYAAVLNENVFTNLWTEHFDGYRRVVETFKLLDKPKRLKPVSVYYHMYSGVYPASLESLEIIYDWAALQKLTNLYLSEYAARARTLYETGIAKTLDGDWQITSTGIRSVRLPLSMGEPNNNISSIHGWQDEPDGRYASLAMSKSIISFKPNKKKSIRLHNANAQILEWKPTSTGIKWQFKAHLPLEVELSNADECEMTTKSSESFDTLSLKNNVKRYKLNKTGLIVGHVSCPNYSIITSD